MDKARRLPSEDETIWLCGRPRFLRETLGHVLKESFGTLAVRDIHDLEPPMLALPEHACWLVWFLNGKFEIKTALDKVVASPKQLNLLLIQSDGHAFVRWADQLESDRFDISLNELTGILQASLNGWRAPSRSSNGGPNVTYRQ
jgi:hypothetical protein